MTTFHDPAAVRPDEHACRRFARDEDRRRLGASFAVAAVEVLG
jgi:hypothetical protein